MDTPTAAIIDATGNVIEDEKIHEYPTFDEMDLPENLLRGVYSHGFTKPSSIQSKAIMPMKNRRDIIAQAQSGTGKTGAFVIGALTQVDETIKKPQVLILVHVHELATQIAKVATEIGYPMKLNVLCAVGGNPVRDDIRALDAGAQFIVGTPGRIYDLMSRNVLHRSEIRVLIMDEADQMLEELFYKQVMCILEQGFPEKTQVALFSATMAETVIAVANKILHNPVRILIPPTGVRLEGIQQFYVKLDHDDHKFECICDLYKNLNISQAVIFCNMRKSAEILASKMSDQGYPITCIHGELPKAERAQRMKDFLSGDCRVLVSTDMLGRGIDVQQVSLVINYELPEVMESYVHRIGRAGRFGHDDQSDWKERGDSHGGDRQEVWHGDESSSWRSEGAEPVRWGRGARRRTC
jgi:translation initiation factor 4A